jgi:lipopolysaccharide biosynthesis glycosyltransferase
MNIVFCANDKCDVEINVAAYSILKQSSAVENKFIVLTEENAPVDERRLAETLGRLQKPHSLELRKVPLPAWMTASRPLNMNHAAYMRLLIPEIVQEDRCIYSDTDVVCNVDLQPVYGTQLHGAVTGCVYEKQVGRSDERELLLTLGMQASDPYFISAFILMDLKAWRNEAITLQGANVIRQHGPNLICHDQTVLNYVLRNKWYPLPECLCHTVPFQAYDRPTYVDTMIHYAYRPKPWDLLWPSWVRRNVNYSLWFNTLKEAGLRAYYRERYPYGQRFRASVKDLLNSAKKTYWKLRAAT